MDHLPALKPMTFFGRLRLYVGYGVYLFLLYIWHTVSPYAVEGIGLLTLAFGPYVYISNRIRAASPDPALSSKDQLMQQIVLACDGQTDQSLHMTLRLLNETRIAR